MAQSFENMQIHPSAIISGNAKIGENAKIAFQKKINNKKKNQVLNDYIKLILKN